MRLSRQECGPTCIANGPACPNGEIPATMSSWLGASHDATDCTPPRDRKDPWVYVEHVVPRLGNLTCTAKTADPLRRRFCAGLVGSVVDVGFGSGLNCAHYPAAVTAVAAAEPSDTWRLSQQGLQGTRVPVERSVRDAHALPYRDHPLTARCRPGVCAPSRTRSRRWRNLGE